MFAFDTAVQPFMKEATPPIWQTLADAGSLLDLTDQPFVQNYDPSAITDAGTYNGKVYEINLARVGFSGLYINKDLFAANNVAVPTTWSELVAACQTFKTANVPCMTAGGQDCWPIFVTGYGILGSSFPDQAAYVEGLWTGTIKYNDAANLEMWEKLQVLAQDMIEPGASGIAADGAPGRFATGEVATLSGFTWLAPAIEAAQPSFDWDFITFPGSDNADDNKYVFGKYDQGWTINANTPNKDAALAYLSRVLGSGQLPGVRDGRRGHPDPADCDARHQARPGDRAEPRELPDRLGAILDRTQGRRRVRVPVCHVLHSRSARSRPPRRQRTPPRPTSRPVSTRSSNT